MKYFYRIVCLIIMCFSFMSFVSAQTVVEEVVAERVEGGFYQDVLKADNGIIAVGGYPYGTSSGLKPSGGLISKYGVDGKIVWEYKVDGASFTSYVSVEKDGSGNYIAVGYYSDPSFYLITKFSEDGKVLWEKKGTNSSYNLSWFDDVLVDENNYVAVGYHEHVANTNDTKKQYPYISKYDTNGELLWESYNTLLGIGRYSAVIKGFSDNYLAVGYFNKNINGTTSTCGLISEYNFNGELLSNKEYCEDEKNININNISVSKNRYAVSYLVDGSSTRLVELDSNFEIIKSEVFKDMYFVDFELYNEGYLVTGYTPGDGDKIQTAGVIFYIDEQFEIKYYDLFDEEPYSLYGKFYLDGDSVVSTRFYTDDSVSLVLVLDAVTPQIVRHYALYDVVTEEAVNGSYKVELDGTLGKITVTPDVGYVLGSITIVDTKGNNIDYYEEDGYYYFEMNDDVTVNVTYKVDELKNNVNNTDKEENPETNDISSLMILVLVVALVIYYCSYTGLNRKSI